MRFVPIDYNHSNVIKLFTLIVVGFLTVSCGNDENGTATLQVALIDAPGDFEKVNIDIQDVQINSGTDEGGFTSLEGVNTGVFDILELTAGLEAILADVELPAGRLSQIRLILGDQNELFIETEDPAAPDMQELTVPSGSQSGLKLNVNLDLEEGITYKVLLDFDASKSIVSTGNAGKYNLKPVIKTSVEATSGAIRGIVDPIGNSTVTATHEDGTENTTFTNDAGEFVLRGLSAGQYNIVVVQTTDLGDEITGTTEAVVEIGVVTDVGSVVLL